MQLISILPDGSMVGLQMKPGKGVDLRQFGKADIERSSLIEWDAEEQGWYVLILNYRHPDGRVAAVVLDRDLFNELTILPRHRTVRESDNAMIYDEYDDAVLCEIEAVQSLRLLRGPDAC